MTWATWITVARILMTPVFLIGWYRGHYTLALATFVVAGISDGLDGYVARRFKQQSLLGQILDPIADKILLSGAFIIAANKQLVPLWVTVLVVLRDSLVVLGGIVFALFFRHRLRIGAMKPTLVGKYATCVEIALVLTLLAMQYFHAPLHVLLDILLVATGAITVFSGGQYLARAIGAATKTEM